MMRTECSRCSGEKVCLEEKHGEDFESLYIAIAITD